MRKLENGEGGEEQRTGGRAEPGKAAGFLGLAPQAGLFISTALLALSFLSHIFFLFLVEPLRYLTLSKEDAMNYSGIPLAIGVLFLISAVYNFIKIESRTASHIVVIILAAAFGSLSLQGLSGIAMHLVRGPHGV